jgi:hypothetical protein
MGGSLLKLSVVKGLLTSLGLFFMVGACAQMGDCTISASWSGAPTGTICSGDTIVLYNQSVDADSWTWTIEDSQINDADSVVIVTSELGGLSVELYVENIEGCIGTTSAQFLVQGIASVAINAQGLIELCDGSATQITAVGTYDQYLWSTGEEENTIFVNESAEIFLTVFDLETGCSARSDTANVVVYPDPDPSIIIEGSTMLCPGDSVVLSTQTFDEYDWNSGPTTQSIVVTAAGYFAVDVTNEYGCGSQSNLVQVQMLPAPSPELSYGGTTVFCADSLFATTLLADTSWQTIEWSDGSTAYELDVISSDAFWYCAQGTNGCWGCSDTIQFISLSPTTIEEIQILDITEGECDGVIDLDVISVFEPLIYAWEIDGESIADNTSDLLGLCEGGEYSLTVTDMAGCSVEWSGALSVLTSVQELDDKLTLFPNPAFDHLSFDRALKNRSYEIMSLDGATVQEGQIVGTSIPTEGLTAGVYYLRLEGFGVYRIVIAN